MKTNYFKSIIPKEYLFTLLHKICRIENLKYVLNYCSYKSGIFNNLIQEFISICKPYYLTNKQTYVTRELTYKSFLTVVRHICKTNNIQYNHHIKYNKSEYEIVYIINTSSDSNISTTDNIETNTIISQLDPLQEKKETQEI
jgi:hypothetical protein